MELLAVIVILAIIALIATPIILNMINDAKKSAAKDSIFGYVEAVENYQTLQMLKNEDGLVKGK
ncbi:MAG: prepilin-type cleavage/methylation domain-containing protein, partial [Bacilli bacterium]|nr:prepilin-type cleavage/methylation domain-containing protein [Bacilli bacterium]